VTWGALFLLAPVVLIGVIVCRLLSRPIDPRGVPTDSLATPVEGDVPEMTRLRHERIRDDFE